MPCCVSMCLLLIFETDIPNNIILVSAGKEHEILLESPDSLVSHIEGICSALIDPSQCTYERNTLHEFVCQFKNPEYYLSRCFACLYPYGRGCPSDKSCGMLSNAKYVKHMLCLGGGPSARRFQQSAGFIFNTYTMEMRRKLAQPRRTNVERNMNEQKKKKIVHERKLQISLLSFERVCPPFVRSCSIFSLNVRSLYEHFPEKKKNCLKL